MKPSVNIVWFRRDLRLSDNAALYHALKAGTPVLPIFIFDTQILDQLEDKKDKRVAFIHGAISEMQTALVGMGSSMQVFYGKPLEVLGKLVEQYTIGTVFTNHDYEPYALERDASVQSFLAQKSIGFRTYRLLR